MITKTVTPREWRTAQGLSLEAAAALAGVTGKNPARTFHRWEKGERCPALDAVDKIAAASGGLVNVQSWVAIRREYESRFPERIAA